MASTSRHAPRLLVLSAVVGLLLLGLHPASASNDSLFDKQWSLAAANVEPAWADTTGAGIRIGIVDSGVNRDHVDLRDRVVDAATCVGPGGCVPGGQDVAGHGTHVAGIAAATMGNGVGIAGVAPGAQLVVAGVFTPGSGSNEPSAALTDVRAGIEYVVAQGAKVVNLSLGAGGGGGILGGLLGGGGNQNSPLKAAVQWAWDHGAIPVIAAGNDNQSLLGANGSYGDLDAVVVGATIRSGANASYSDTLGAGTKWGIVAPGGDNNGVDADMILSTFAVAPECANNPSACYAYLSGTSMAAPMVTGTLALLLSQGLSREDAIATLLSTADKVNCGAGCQGRLNVGNAVAAHAGTHPAPTAAPTPTTRKKVVTTTPKTTVTTTAPTTSSSAVPDTTVPSTTTTEKQREAIILNSSKANSDKSVPAGTGAAGVVLLGIAAIGTFLSVRRTFTSGATH